MQEQIVTQTHWIDDGKGGVKPVEIQYVEKDKGDCTILTPVKNNDSKEQEVKKDGS